MAHFYLISFSGDNGGVTTQRLDKEGEESEMDEEKMENRRFEQEEKEIAAEVERQVIMISKVIEKLIKYYIMKKKFNVKK